MESLPPFGHKAQPAPVRVAYSLIWSLRHARPPTELRPELYIVLIPLRVLPVVQLLLSLFQFVRVRYEREFLSVLGVFASQRRCGGGVRKC